MLSNTNSASYPPWNGQHNEYRQMSVPASMNSMSKRGRSPHHQLRLLQKDWMNNVRSGGDQNTWNSHRAYTTACCYRTSHDLATPATATYKSCFIRKRISRLSWVHKNEHLRISTSHVTDHSKNNNGNNNTSTVFFCVKHENSVFCVNDCLSQYQFLCGETKPISNNVSPVPPTQMKVGLLQLQTD